ncbi:unnamed protein product [Microthlaspi erraticum]|uniref:Uncharacterized protein n=1 Tax=Microthlaspi erraticum TaxID=1685480 RepID=A0A6D2L4K1_9BRAS|nr:unnamed protein product [Microthlaspi erraticum]
MFLSTNSTSSKIQDLSWCHHVGTWSPQSPWRREHCSALGTWGAHPPLALPQPLPWLILVPSCHLHQPIGSPLLLPLHSQFPHSFLHLESHFPLLNKVHSNLKLPLLTLTTYGIIPLLGSPFLPQLSLSDFFRVDISLHQILPSLILSSLGFISKPSPCILFISLPLLSSVKLRLPSLSTSYLFLLKLGS